MTQRFIFAALFALWAGAASAQTTQCVSSAVAGGTGDALTVPLLPCTPTANLLVLTLTATNTTTTPTLKITGSPIPAAVIQSSDSTAVGVGGLAAGNKVLLTFTGTNWNLLSTGAGSFLLRGNNLSDLTSEPTAVANLGLGLGSPLVADKATLAASATTAFPNGVWRKDYSAGLGAPPLFYTAGTVPCTQNAGAGDGGYCVPSSDGKSWVARFVSNDYDPREWGADFTGVTNSVAAIQATAAAAVANGANIVFECGTYLVTSSASEVILINSFGNTRVMGAGSCVKFTGTLGASTDLIHVKPTGAVRAFEIGQFNAAGLSGGQAIVDLDATANTTTSLFDTIVHDIEGVTAGSKYGVWVRANNTSMEGALVHGRIYNNTFNSTAGGAAIQIQNGGDSILIDNNILTGAGYGAYIWQCHLGGCAGLTIRDNNITALAASVRLDGGTRPVIINNEMELAGASGTGAMLSIAGSDTAVLNPAILYNTVHCVGSCSGVSELILINGGANPTTNAIIDGNDLSSSLGGVIGSLIVAGATGTIIGPNNLYTTLGSAVSDSGTGSQIGVSCGAGFSAVNGRAYNGMITHC